MRWSASAPSISCMEAEAFSRLISGTSLLKEFERYPVPFYIWAQDSGTTVRKGR
jgi:hypothetical protein